MHYVRLSYANDVLPILENTSEEAYLFSRREENVLFLPNDTVLYMKQNGFIYREVPENYIEENFREFIQRYQHIGIKDVPLRPLNIARISGTIYADGLDELISISHKHGAKRFKFWQSVYSPEYTASDEDPLLRCDRDFLFEIRRASAQKAHDGLMTEGRLLFPNGEKGLSLHY